MTTNLAAHLATLPEVQAELKALGWTAPEDKPKPILSPLGEWTRIVPKRVYSFPESPTTKFFSNYNDMLFLYVDDGEPPGAVFYLFCHANRVNQVPAALAKLLATIPTP
jgi:hypothetical protein